MKKNYHKLKTRLGLSASLMMLFTLGMKAQCPSISSIKASPENVCSGGNSQLQVEIPLSYSATSITFAPIAIPGSGVTVLCDTGTVIDSVNYNGPSDYSNIDDASWSDLTIPFDFGFFGTTYNSFGVGTNGSIFLGSGRPVNGEGDYTNQGYDNEFPNPYSSVAPCIAGIYADLNFNYTGTISYFTTGTAPNRILVINYIGGQFWTSAPDPPYAIGSLTTQILLYETTNIIEVHTTHSTGDNNAVEGVQDATGTLGYTVADRNNQSWAVDSLTPDAYRFELNTDIYSWSPATFLSSTTIANPMATGVTSTTTYTVTITSGTCTTTESVTVNQSPLESGSEIGPSDIVCAGSDISLAVYPSGGGEPYSYAWEGPDGFASTSQYPDIVGISMASQGTYTVTVTDLCGSNSITTVDLTVNTLPSVMVSPSTGSICSDGTTSVALSASGTATSYEWSPSEGILGSTSGTDVDVLPVNTTTYIVTGTDDNGCASSAEAVITVNDPPVIALTATPSAVCSGGSSELMAVASLPTTRYDVTSIAYEPVPTPGAGTITTLCDGGEDVTSLDDFTNLDDGYWKDQPLPFTVNYFGMDYTSFAVGTNGFVSLGDGSPSAYSWSTSGDAFPNPYSAHSSIGANYADMDFRFQGSISYFTTGIEPNRILVINYNDGQFYFGDEEAIGSFTTQVLIYETSNVIEIHTANSTGENSAVEGIQNADGSTGFVVPERNGVNWEVATPDAYRFAPPTSTYTYEWAGSLSSTSDNPTATDITSTTSYDVIATAATGCVSASTSISVTVNPVISFMAPALPICLQAAPITLTATPEGGVFTGAGVDTVASTFDPGAAGVGAISVMYTVTDSNSCTGSLTQDFIVEDCTGITENSFSQDVNMYPNPTNGMFNIEIQNVNFNSMKISIIDPQGKEVYNVTDKNISSTYKQQINLENLAKGIYFIKLSTDNGMKVKKLTLQ